MTQFHVKNGHFWLDDRPQLIQAGEFHYFRTPQDQWPQRLGMLQKAGFNTLATYIPWLWHQPEADVSDLHGRSHPMRDLAGFLDLAADMGFLLIPRPGPYIMAETINEGIPPWVFARHPQAAFVSQDGKTQNIASYLHPDFLACVRRWYQAVFEVLTPRQVTRGGQIILIQLDNEMGMPHWVRNIFDVNPDTVARFAAHVRERYGSRLPARYPAADLPAALRAGLLDPATPHAAHVVADYRHFYRDYLQEYAAFLWDEARANGMEVPPIVNVHGFMNGGKTFPIGLSQLVKVMEMDGMVSATDVYPLHIGEGNFHQLLFVNETTKALQNPAQALFSVEFQSGGNQDFSGSQASMYDLHTRLCISAGMRAINHYSFFAGTNDPVLSPVQRHDWGPPVRNDGTPRTHFHRYARLSAVLHAYGTALTRSRPFTTTTLGFQLDNFMTEVNSAATQDATRIITHQREVILCDFIARGLALTHRPFDAVELSRAALNPAHTPHCWVMMDRHCPPAVQQKLVDYARQGGRLVLIGRICLADFDDAPCTILKDALGIAQATADAPFTETRITAFHHHDVPASFVESYTGRFADVFATRAGSAARPTGETVGFRQPLGRGEVVLFGAALPANTLEDLDILHQIARRIGCPPLFALSEWADVRLSRGAAGSFLFINNYQDDPVAPTIALENERLFGGYPIPLPARRGLILPLDWQLHPGVLLHYATAEITHVAVDDAAIRLHTEPAGFTAEFTLTGYHIPGAAILATTGAGTRVRLHGRDGHIVLHKAA
ncbi:MAG: beta-galactosidase [Anaerolineales bacterium]|nr:beta-galactosidase [Anaerolineales bacterium]